jgi:hypothetical protein
VIDLKAKKDKSGCTLDVIKNKAKLNQENLIIQDVECRNATISNLCQSRESYIEFRCRDGFKFANEKSKLT